MKTRSPMLAIIRIRIVALFFLVFFSHSIMLCGQEFPTLHYTFEDGLPSNTIYQVYRDRKGFLWIGTDKGVARYNGTKFDVFTSFDGLPDNEIYFFREDYDGRLWMATSNGKLCFFKNNTFHTESNTDYLKLPFKLPHIGFISIETDSSVSISSYDPSVLTNFKKNERYILRINRVKMPNVVNDFFYKRKIAPDKYMIFSRDCIYTLDTFHRYQIHSTMSFDTNLRVKLCQDQEYISNDKYLFNDQMKIIRPLFGNLFFKTRINSYYFDGSDYFTCTKDGLFLNDTIRILKDEDVSSITQDCVGNYWVATLNAGLFCLRRDFIKMKKHDDIYLNKLFYCKAKKGNVYYTTSDNNLFVFNGKQKKILFDFSKYVDKEFTKPNDAAYLLDDNNKYYNVYKNNYLVIDDVGLYPLSPRIYYHTIEMLGIKKIVVSESGIFLRAINDIVGVSTHGINERENIEEKHLMDPKGFVKTYNLIMDNHKNVWYSTMYDLFIIRNGKGVTQRQFKDVSLKSFEFLGDNMVGYTFNNHLLIISDIYKHIRVDTIFSSNCTWNKLYKLNDSMMLISTNNFDRFLTIHSGGSSKFSLITIEDPFVPINIEAFCSDSSNCYFFKDGSLTSMSINSLFKKSEPPKLFFSQIRAGGKVYQLSEEIELPYDESRNITIPFEVHSFGGKNAVYQYSMSKDGKDNWHSIKGEEINFVGISYGNYLIKVRAKTIGSDYSPPIVFKLHILRPFWATWWFLCLCLTVVIILIVTGVRLRILYLVRKNKKIHETEVKFVKSEFKAMNALMNPHFIFNTLNNVQSLFNANDKLAANEYLRIFADLIRQNMHNVSKELIPLQREIVLVMNYLILEKLRFEDKLNYVVNIDEGIDTSEFLIPPLLIQPLVENSIKHGILPKKESGGTIIINVNEKNGMLCIEVKDDGVGLSKKNTGSGIMHESFGMENIKKRIEQLSLMQERQFTLTLEEIKDVNGNQLWTVATICMPTL